jgi:hypothetical protein
MFDKDHRELLTGVVEVDETYIGGRSRENEVVRQKKLLLWEWCNMETKSKRRVLRVRN